MTENPPSVTRSLRHPAARSLSSSNDDTVPSKDPHSTGLSHRYHSNENHVSYQHELRMYSHLIVSRSSMPTPILARERAEHSLAHGGALRWVGTFFGEWLPESLLIS